ncbi:MAG: hypothetical protein IJ048_05595, partial [Clostridia bacterium]|nr:hypothetical protein [Clostridia bacterium]
LISAGLVLAMAVSTLAGGLALAGVNTRIGRVTADGAAVEDGVQTIVTELDYGSYPAITVTAGVPVRWNLHAEAGKLNGCNSELVIPALNMRVPLEPGDNWMEFTPTEAGVIPYSCWMGMIRSSITVVEGEQDGL